MPENEENPIRTRTSEEERILDLTEEGIAEQEEETKSSAKNPALNHALIPTHNPPLNPAHNSQIYSIVTGKDPSWQSIIYELISTEQINPWDIDIALLCKGYFEKIKEMEEHNFFMSSKILLAASLLLRIKSEILLDRYIKEIDEVLFGREEETKRILERIEIDMDEVPILAPKSPLPRFKKVTLDELMQALDTAIKTESRRINKELEKKQTERLAYIDIPKFRRINIKDRIRQFYAKILSSFQHPKHKSSIKLPYSHFTNNNRDEKIACFLPMLHLSNNNKVWLEQMSHYEEIWVYLYESFKKNFPDYDKELNDLPEQTEAEIEGQIEEELVEEIEHLDEEMHDERRKRVERINKDFENPIGDLLGDSEEQ